MRQITKRWILSGALALLGASATAGAQPPAGARAMRGAPAGRGGAEFLLAHTGALQLTDQQVVRLAAIARRAESRRRALRDTLERQRAAAPRVAPGDSAARGRMRMRMGPGGPPPEMVARMQALREQARVDLRDALAVLTPDQQAMAWTMRGPGGAAPRAMGRAMGREMRRPGGGPDGPAAGMRRRGPPGA